MNSSFVGLYRITRPGNALVCALAVLSGGLLGGKPLTLIGDAASSILAGQGAPGWFVRVISASFSASLILAAGNVFNDIRDIRPTG